MAKRLEPLYERKEISAPNNSKLEAVGLINSARVIDISGGSLSTKKRNTGDCDPSLNSTEIDDGTDNLTADIKADVKSSSNMLSKWDVVDSNSSRFIRRGLNDVEHNENISSNSRISQELKQAIPPESTFIGNCHFKEEVMYCQSCSYSHADLDKLKIHKFREHPTGTAIIANKFDGTNCNPHDITLFCVKETCRFSTNLCNIYEIHLMSCCMLYETLSEDERERLKSTVKFVLDFHSKHDLKAVPGFLDYTSTFRAKFMCQDDIVQINKELEYKNSSSMLSDSVSDLDVSISFGNTGTNFDHSVSSFPIPVLLFKSQNIDFNDKSVDKTGIFEDASLSAGEQEIKQEHLSKPDLYNVTFGSTSEGDTTLVQSGDVHDVPESVALEIDVAGSPADINLLKEETKVDNVKNIKTSMDPFSRGKQLLRLSMERQEQQTKQQHTSTRESDSTSVNLPESDTLEILVKDIDISEVNNLDNCSFSISERSDNLISAELESNKTGEPFATSSLKQLRHHELQESSSASSDQSAESFHQSPYHSPMVALQASETEIVQIIPFQTNDTGTDKIIPSPTIDGTAQVIPSPTFDGTNQIIPSPIKELSNKESLHGTVLVNGEDQGVRMVAINNSEIGTTASEIDNEPSFHSKKRKIKGFSEWKQNKRKSLREKGLEYTSPNGNLKDAKMLKPPCSCASKATECSVFSEFERHDIFYYIWKLTWEERRSYIKGLLEKNEPKRRYTKHKDSRINFTWAYFLPKDTIRVKVCKKMFLSTTGVTQHCIRAATDQQPPTAQLRPKNPHYERGVDAKSFAVTFLNDLPKLPSHFSRLSSSKLYLEPCFKSLIELHRFYTASCAEKGQQFLGVRAFTDLIESKNISMFKPKKDHCDMCMGHKIGNVSDEIWSTHMRRIGRVEDEKAKDKADALNSEDVTVLCMDLQGVLLAPSMNAPSTYFKSKLGVHNFTVYNLKTRGAVCYVWHEAEGALTSNEFTSCIIDFLSSCRNAKKITLYSDGCVYKNKNSTLASALSHFSSTTNIEVQQKYLIKGHTHTEVDSMHGVIERKLKGVPIYSPTDYLAIFRSARSTPKPYEIRNVDHSFFKNYGSVATFKTIRPGRQKGNPTVNEVRCFKYTPDGTIHFKISFDDEWQSLPKGKARLDNVREAPSLYNSRLNISQSKFKDLQDLKAVIPVDYHPFYDNLPH